MERIIRRIEKLIKLTEKLLSENPDDTELKGMLDVLNLVKIEIPKSSNDYLKMRQFSYGITRTYQEILNYEETPFGKEMDLLLLELIEYLDKININKQT